MEFLKVLEGKRGRIWVALIRQPGMSVSETARQTGFAQSSVTDHLKVLIREGFIKTKEVPPKRGPVKRKLSWPTLKPIYQQIAKLKRKHLTSNEYDMIDSFFFDKDSVFRKTFLKEIEKKWGKKADPLIVMAILIGRLQTNFFIKVAKGNPQALKQYNKIKPIWRKLFH